MIVVKSLTLARVHTITVHRKAHEPSTNCALLELITEVMIRRPLTSKA